jgi:hypothetical protein
MSETASKKDADVRLLTKSNVNSFIFSLKKMSIPFTMKKSNYACSIKYGESITRFVSSYQSNRCFAGFSKIKKDIRDKQMPVINYNNVKYFLHNFRKSASHKSVVNIDLKSAYANILLKENIISPDTFKYLSSMPKKDRLVSVGMLASKKEIFIYDKGANLIDFEISKSEYESYFFIAVQRTYEIMTTLKNICEQDYLFTWVDGIYFKPDAVKTKRCIDYLKEIEFPYSIDMLSNFNVKMFEHHVNVEFMKGKDKKIFNIPVKHNYLNKVNTGMEQFLNNKIKNNETSKVKNPTW